LTGSRKSVFGRSVFSKVMGFLRVIAVVTVVALLATSCASNDAEAPKAKAQPQPPRQIHITATDKSYKMPGELESEPVRSALSKSPDALFSLVTVAGSMREIEPGATSEIGMLFPEGHYLVIDPEVEGLPPLRFFAVSAASGPEVAEPMADYSIEAGDFYFKISDSSPGEATVEIANVGKQSHEVGIGKGVKGKRGEVTTVFAPAPGGKMWTTLTLEPGDYALLCFLPDPKTGKPHIKLGMKQSFSVN
jgi:hypothetical protein